MMCSGCGLRAKKQDDSSYIQLRNSLESNKFQQLADTLRNLVQPTTNRRGEDLFLIVLSKMYMMRMFTEYLIQFMLILPLKTISGTAAIRIQIRRRCKILVPLAVLVAILNIFILPQYLVVHDFTGNVIEFID